MRRVWCNYRELELRLGSSISVYCLSSYGCQMTDHPKCSPNAATNLRNGLDAALKMLEQPQANMAAIAASKLN